ncbi:MAG TPA: cupin domain-containing protein [Thermoleophilaceae bacterium]|nr:cupin domain-containing protein [Thermoleophilaceae bacterium]
MGINIEKPDFDEPRDRDGFRVRRAGVGRRAGAVKLGATVWELPPGEAAYPYHFHLGVEEMIVVLSGTPTLRAPDGEREVDQGELLVFLPGERGAHQLINRSKETARFLSVSTMGALDLVVYPDSNKIACHERGGLRELHLRANAVDYWEGESPPG